MVTLIQSSMQSIMGNQAKLQEILNAIDILSIKDKTQLIERVAVNLKQELVAQNLLLVSRLGKLCLKD